MNRRQFEHAVKAAATIADCETIVAVGSQALLGSIASPDETLTVSMELDVYSEDHPELADVIDGAIGEGSLFHETFGYYVHGVGPETATLPKEWRSRAVRVSSDYLGTIIAVCPSPVDLAVSKLAAGREKDLEFVSHMIQNKLINLGQLRNVVDEELDENDVASTILPRFDFLTR